MIAAARPRDPSCRAVAAAAWHDELAGLTADRPGEGRADYAVRAFNATSPIVAQPVLTEDIVCLHRGGAKRVHRRHGSAHTIYDIENGALTLMPRGQANGWETIGPIDYVHLTLGAATLSGCASEDFECDDQRIELRDDVGFRDALVEPLFHELMLCARDPAGGRLYTDALLAALTRRLLRTRSSLAARHLSCEERAVRSAVKGGLPDWRLRRIADYLRDHLADEVSLTELCDIAGVSRAQFFRAFRQSTGTTPVRYLTDLRLERARDLVLRDTEIDEVVRATGFTSTCGLSAAFRRHFGQTPKQLARCHK